MQAKNKLVYSWHQVLSICPDSPYRDPLFAGGLERSLGVSFSEFSECPVRGLVFFVLFVVLSFVRGHPPARHASPPGISRLQPRRTGKARRAGLCLRGKFCTSCALFRILTHTYMQHPQPKRLPIQNAPPTTIIFMFL